MESVCAGYLDSSVFESQQWSFGLIDYSAVPVEGTAGWSADSKLGVLPDAAYLPIASGGVVVDASKDASTPHCKQDKLIAGPGDGTVVVGFAGDASTDAAAFTAWANHNYGFSAEKDIVLSNCKYLVTDAGRLLNGGGDSWRELSDTTNCVVGNGSESAES